MISRKTTKNKTAMVDQPPLPSNRAFVVQFYGAPQRTPSGIAGRVEHLETHHAAHFYSLAELKAFFLNILNEAGKEERKNRRVR